MEEQVSLIDQEKELDQLLENESLTRALLMFLDLKIVHELLEISLSELNEPPYQKEFDDQSFGELPDGLKKLYQLIYLKTLEKATFDEVFSCDGGCLEKLGRLRNELVLLPALFENLVHGACEVPWDVNFVISSDWQVIEDQ
jgi:hypothetical protein